MDKFSQNKQWDNIRGSSTENSDGLAAYKMHNLNNLEERLRINEKVYAVSGHEQCKGPHYTKDCPLKEEGKTLEEAYYTSLDPFLEDYIELNDLNDPFELRRNQEDDLMPTIEEGALMNVSIFVGTFSVMTDFAVLENMDAYRDEGMGDVIFGEPLLREADIKAKRFEGMLTLYKGDDEVTYQMVRSHSRFKHHTNEQCNKIPPLLKVNEKDVMNGVSHEYQKLKGFYKGF
ncbi:hypothetical protein Tco_0397135 [Tanacetum coccineum]